MIGKQDTNKTEDRRICSLVQKQCLSSPEEWMVTRKDRRRKSSVNQKKGSSEPS